MNEDPNDNNEGERSNEDHELNGIINQDQDNISGQNIQH